MTRSHRPFKDPAVKAVFDSWPAAARKSLLRFRDLILETAEGDPRIGEIEETLKWGQPSYLTVRPKTGTTVRLDAPKSDEGTYGLYFHCRTSLLETYRMLYPDTFAYEGNRAIVFRPGEPVDREALRHCITLALTYHRTSA